MLQCDLREAEEGDRREEDREAAVDVGRQPHDEPGGNCERPAVTAAASLVEGRSQQFCGSQHGAEHKQRGENESAELQVP